jgi:hypothetical protein
MVENVRSEEFAKVQLAVSMLGEFLTKDASSEQHIQEIIDRELAQGLTVDTFGALGRRLTEYIGDDPANFLMLFLSEEDPKALLEPIQEIEELSKKDDLILFLRRLRALCGETVQTALTIWRENPDDWRNAKREVHYDQLAEEWVLQLTIRKYNDEVMSIKGSASSFLNLANFLLRTLNLVTDPTAIYPSHLKEFQSELEVFMKAHPMTLGNAVSE